MFDVLKEKRVEEKDEGTRSKAFFSLGQLAGGVILGVALWLRHDSQTSNLLMLKFEGHQAPGTFYISEYTVLDAQEGFHLHSNMKQMCSRREKLMPPVEAGCRGLAGLSGGVKEATDGHLGADLWARSSTQCEPSHVKKA